MGLCTICREADAPGDPTSDDTPLCPACGKLFRWFLDHFDDVAFGEEWRMTPGTTFQELSIESLDHVEWLHEAEKQFGVTIPDRDAEGLRSVGDYLRFIRLHANKTGSDLMPDRHHPLWDRGLDG